MGTVNRKTIGVVGVLLGGEGVGEGCLNQFYLRETSTLILMQLQIIIKRQVRIGVLYFSSVTSQVTIVVFIVKIVENLASVSGSLN